MDEQMITMAGQIATLKTLSMQLAKDFKGFQKQYDKEKKLDSCPKKRRRGKKPTGFASPTAVSTELKVFLGLEDKEKIARTEVTKRIIAYVKDNNLNVGTKIKVDSKLKTIVKLDDDDTELTFFNLQTHINHNFIKHVCVPDINL